MIPVKNTHQALAIAVAILLGALAVRSFPASADGGRALPPPVVDVKSAASGSAVAVFRGWMLLGCAGRLPARQRRDERGVWTTPAATRTADYETVSMGTTGHAESVQVTYDLRQVTLRAAAAGVLLSRARPHGVEQARARHGHAVSIRSLPDQRRAGQRCQGLHRPARSGPCVPDGDRDHGSSRGVRSTPPRIITRTS